jgi:hypothetical protein
MASRVLSPVNAAWGLVQLHAGNFTGAFGDLFFDSIRVSRVLTTTGIDVDGVELLNIIDASATYVSAYQGSNVNIGPDVPARTETLLLVPSFTVEGSGRVAVTARVTCSFSAGVNIAVASTYTYTFKLYIDGDLIDAVNFFPNVYGATSASPGAAATLQVLLAGTIALTGSVTTSLGAHSLTITADVPHSGGPAGGANSTVWQGNARAMVIQSRR